MKKILFLLLLSVTMYGQVPADATPLENIQITNNIQDTISDRVSVSTSDGVLNWKYAKDLIIPAKAFLSTGIIKNGLISANGDPTKFNITAGIGIISNFDDPENPISTIINFPAFNSITPTYLTTGNITYVAINSTPAVVMQATPFTPEQRRSLIVLGATIHSNLTTINVLNNISAPTNADTNQLHDFMEAVGALNITGNKYTANGANLQLNKSAGVLFKLGSNFAVDWKNPHEIAQAGGAAITFRYRTQNGTESADMTSISPGLYDLNNVLTTVPNNKFTIQTFNVFQTGLSRAQWDQTYYDDLQSAKNAILTREFAVENNIKENGVARAYIIVRNSTTSLQNVADAYITEVQKFGGVASGGVALTLANIVTALGYTPENEANKQNSLVVDGTGIKYPTVDAVNAGLALRQEKKNITIVGSGQSNMLGMHSGGDMTSDSRVKVWRKDTSVWAVADLSLPPFNGNNNLAFQFAKKYAEENNVEVKLILNADTWQAISKWVGVTPTMYTDLTTQITNSGTTNVDVLLWHQGEADYSVNTVSNYAVNFLALVDKLRAETWFSETAPIIAGELLNVYPQMNGFYQNIRFNDWIKDKNVTVAQANDLTGDIVTPDPIHFSGAEMVILGRERYWTAFKSIGNQYDASLKSVFKPLGVNRLAVGENAFNINEFSPTLNIDGTSIAPLMSRKDGTSFWINEAYANTNTSPHFESRKARGTRLVPLPVINNDILGDFTTYGWGSSFVKASEIRTHATQNWSGSLKGSRFSFWLNNDSNIYGERMVLYGNGDLLVNGNITLSSGTLANHGVTFGQVFTSPTFTGAPSVPTATAGTNTTQIASTAFVQANVNANAVLLTGNQSISGQKTFNVVSDFGIRVNNGIADPSSGASFVVSSTGTGNAILNQNLGIGQSIQNQSSGKGLSITNVLDGEAIRLTSSTGSTGKLLSVFEISNERAFIDKSGNFSMGLLTLKTYTVATLPTPTGTAYATVTDALAPSYLGTLTGGGTVVTPVFYDGTVWRSTINAIDTSDIVYKTGIQTITGLKIFTENVYATGFVKTGGTASQFLKADGSVDESDVVRNIAKDATQGANITGTVSETILYSKLIPANTFKDGDFMTLFSRVAKVSGVGTLTQRVKINTSNTLTGAIQIATNFLSFSNSYGAIRRNFNISNGFIYGFSFTTAVSNDATNNNVASTSSTFNPAIDNYIFITGELNSSSETMYHLGTKITN